MAQDSLVSGTSSSKDVPPANEPAPWQKKPKHDPSQNQAGKMWEAFGNPSEPVNELPGGTYNSAGGKPRELTWKAAFDFKIGEVKRIYKVPCARDAFLVGIGGGAAVGGVTAIIRGLRGMRMAAHLSVAGFVVMSIGQYEWCESRRKEEAKGIALAMIGMKKLQEKKRLEKEAEEARIAAAAAEAEKLLEEQRQKRKSAWSFW